MYLFDPIITTDQTTEHTIATKYAAFVNVLATNGLPLPKAPPIKEMDASDIPSGNELQMSTIPTKIEVRANSFVPSTPDMNTSL